MEAFKPAWAIRQMGGVVQGPPLSWWKSRGYFRNIDGWFNQYISYLDFNRDTVWLPGLGGAVMVAAGDTPDDYRDGAWWWLQYGERPIPGQEFADRRPALIEAAQEAAIEQQRAARDQARRDKIRQDQIARERQATYDRAYQRALSGVSLNPDDKTPVLVLVKSGEQWGALVGPQLAQASEREKWEQAEGPIPFPAGAVIGARGGYYQDRNLARAGIVLTWSEEGWRPPTLQEIGPYLSQLGQIEKDQSQYEQQLIQGSRNRAAITASQTYTNRAPLSTVVASGRNGGLGAFAEKR